MTLEELQKEGRELLVAITDDGYTKPTFGDLESVDYFAAKVWQAAIDACVEAMPPKNEDEAHQMDCAEPDRCLANQDYIDGQNEYREEALSALSKLKNHP